MEYSASKFRRTAIGRSLQQEHVADMVERGNIPISRNDFDVQFICCSEYWRPGQGALVWSTYYFEAGTEISVVVGQAGNGGILDSNELSHQLDSS